MAEFPYENTLTTNITHQQLVDLEQNHAVSGGSVTSPARIKEREKGYDVKFDTAKQVVYQYKRPQSIVNRNGETWFSFPVNNQQVDVLQMRNQIGQAFLVLPLAGNSRKLNNTFESKDSLEKTVFIDAFSNIKSTTSRIYIAVDSLNSGSIKVKGKYGAAERYRDIIDPRSYYPLRSTNILTWKDFSSQLAGCQLEVVIKYPNQLSLDVENNLSRVKAFEEAFKKLEFTEKADRQARADNRGENDSDSALLVSNQADTIVETTISELQRAEVMRNEELEERQTSLRQTLDEIADTDHPPTTSIQDSLDAIIGLKNA